MAPTVTLNRIDEPGQLLRYAAIAQLEHVRKSTGYGHERIATNLEMDPGTFSKRLRAAELPDDFLRDLDEAIMALVPDMDRTGGLSALAMRLRRMGGRDALTARHPPAWRRRMLDPRRPAVDELDHLAKASGLLAKLLAVPEFAGQVCERNAVVLTDVVKRLISIGAAPPTPNNVDALILLGSIAGVPAAFTVVEELLKDALANHPFGFRIWRAVTTIVRFNEGNRAAGAIRPWVKDRLSEAEDMRRESLFPARSLDLELAIAIPRDWSESADDDWASSMLRRRAENDHATVRERGTAALGLWERAVAGRDVDYQVKIEEFLRDRVTAFEAEAEAGGVLLGLRWVAATLRYCLDTKEAVCNEWLADEPCVDVVREATKRLDGFDIPSTLLRPTKILVEHSLLQNAGVYRRTAVDTLLASAYTAPAIDAFQDVLTQGESPAWLKCRALFAISFLQDRERAHEPLVNAFKNAKANFDRSVKESSPDIARGVASELHAALFAIGDCFGAVGAEQQATWVRRDLDPALKELLKASQNGTQTHDHLWRVGRAAAYVVAVTAQPTDHTSRPMLKEIQKHRDPTIQRLAGWGLRRFDRAQVKPIHEIAW